MFAGIFARTGGDGDGHLSLAESLLEELNPFRVDVQQGIWAKDTCLLVETQLPESSGNLKVIPYRFRPEGPVVAAWARLDNRDQLVAELGSNLPQPDPLDAALILAAWQRWGASCVQHLVGDFAFAIVDPHGGQVFLARDPIGVRPLYYRLTETSFQFSTTASAIRRLSGSCMMPDTKWMAHFLLSELPVSCTDTALEGVQRLSPGHWLLVTEDKVQTQAYFDFRDEPPSAFTCDPAWVDSYRVLLEDSVKCRIGATPDVGVEVSGGIDSAGIVAYLARSLNAPGEQLHGFGYATSDDEASYILEVSRHCGIADNFLISHIDPDSDDDISRVLRVHGYPPGDTNLMAMLPFLRDCQTRGIGKLFSGFGGDEAVSNNGYLLRTELLDSHAYRSLFRILPGNPVLRSLRFLKAMWVHRRDLMTASKCIQTWNARWPLCILRPEVVSRLGLESNPWPQGSHEAPFRRINDLVLSELSFQHVGARLESCSLLARSYGVECEWPLLDVRLIQQYLSTPSIEKCGSEGVGRYLHRRAISSVVPPRVAWNPRKAFDPSNYIRRLVTINIVTAAEQARRQDAHLHPALAELVDREKFRSQIELAAKGNVDPQFGFSFMDNVRSIRWLNQWLHGKPVD